MKKLQQNQNRIISVRKSKKLLILCVFVFMFDIFFFPMPTLANDVVEKSNINVAVAIKIDNSANISAINSVDFYTENNLPQNDSRGVEYVVQRTITAYNSEVGQCDDSPCITANGFNLCKHAKEDTVATNSLKFGVKVRIPALFGDKVFVVRDRMNERYPDRFDVWMVDKQDARKFGVKRAQIEVLE